MRAGDNDPPMTTFSPITAARTYIGFVTDGDVFCDNGISADKTAGGNIGVFINHRRRMNIWAEIHGRIKNLAAFAYDRYGSPEPV